MSFITGWIKLWVSAISRREAAGIVAALINQ
jgi:hypothetical protein